MIKSWTRYAVPIAVLWSLVLSGCGNDAQSGPARSEPAGQAKESDSARRARFLDPAHAPVGGGWVALFNGKDLAGWHPRVPDRKLSWRVEDGLLRNQPENHEGVDLVCDETFYNFETYYEYRIPPRSNSGYYLRGRYEIQILDSFGQPPGVQQDGAFYSLVAPSKNVSREPGQWQSVYARIVGNRATVVMNGETIIDNAELTRATGGELDQNYDQPGPILLQGDHGTIDFRNIYIRPLPR